MSQTVLSDPEVGGGPGGPADDHRDHPTMTSNQPSQGESNFGDSSGPLFTIYSKAAEEEDNRMVERWQKDADGILIFTGLFSASVAALLSVTVQDLRPNSQDTSAFYLGNIYQVLADPNVTRSPTPLPVFKPPSFSPSRYAVWVNSLWFLSLVMGLSCALWAISLQQWARRYLHRAQPSRCSPEKRARMRAFFSGGVEKMHIPWAVEGLPTLLHLSLFLFFGGLALFLFNVDREVFIYVIWWIGLFFLVYGMITLLPLIRKDSPYNSPLSTPVWFLLTTMTYLTVKILGFIFLFCFIVFYLICFCSSRIERTAIQVFDRIKKEGEYYRCRMLGGEKAVEEMASEGSSKIDLEILDWTIGALGDNDSLKSFFEAIPGFFSSRLINLEGDLPRELVEKFRDVRGFLRHTWTSNSVDHSEKLRRLDISLSAISQIMIMSPSGHQYILRDILSPLLDEVPQTIEIGHILARWSINKGANLLSIVQENVVGILINVRERNDGWVTLATQVFGLPERDLWDNIALGGDNVLLAILLHVIRQYLRSSYWKWSVFEAVSKIDICNTLPRLQHDYCTLWNQLVKKSRDLNTVSVLKRTRHLYLALHQGTDAAPTVFSASTHDDDHILYRDSSYPLCNLASHCPDSIARVSAPLSTPPANSPDAFSPLPTDSGNTASRQAEQVKNVIQPTTSKIGTTPHGPDMTSPTNLVHPSSRPSGASPTAVVATTPQYITSTTKLSHPLEGGEHQEPDIVAPSTESGTTTSIHAPTSTAVPIPTSLPNMPSDSYDAGDASVSNPSHFASLSIGSSIPTSRPTASATLPRLRPRGLVNTRNICFVNAVLHLLVNSPPFRSLFRELGDLKAQRRPTVPETGCGETPLVDATVRFFKEFLVEEESPSTQRRSQPATGGTSRVDEEKKGYNIVDSFEPTYMYDAMKEKRQLKSLLDGQQQDAEEFLCIYLDALDEELHLLLAGHRSACEAEEGEVSQPGQAEVASRGFVANFVESPIMHIFGGKLCSHVRTSNKPDVVTTEDWRLLHLDIQDDSIRTVQDTLAHISQPQSVQVTASGFGNANQQVLIEALPLILVLHLNRVQYDAAAGGITKIAKTIQLAPELEIPLDIMVPTAQRPSEPPHYKLYGVLYHHGEYAGSGHYTVDVLHPNGDDNTGEVWLHIDNEAVSPVRHEDVFGEHGTEQAADEGCAYLLFYCRTSPIATS